jgi:hypothetical protein
LTSTFTPSLIRTIGSFTKLNAGTAVEVTWNSLQRNIGAPANNTFCQWQVRIDGAVATGLDSSNSGAVMYGEHAPVLIHDRWTGLSAGTHTISIWLRGGGGQCTDTWFGFEASTLVVER